MKKFTVPCNFNGQQAPFTVYVGSPEPLHHPLHFQAEWLSKMRGGVIPSEIMKSLSDLFELSKKNNISFEELCVYALNNENNGGDGSGAPTAPGAEPPMPT